MPGPVQIVLCVMPPQNAFKQQKSPASQVSLKAGVPNLIISQWVYSSQVPKSLGLVFEEHEAPADPSMLPPLLFPEKKNEKMYIIIEVLGTCSQLLPFSKPWNLSKKIVSNLIS